VADSFADSGGLTVIVDLRTAWCCKAAHPSVALSDFHLYQGKFINIFTFTPFKGSLPYVRERYPQNACIIHGRFAPSNFSIVCVG